MRASARLVSAVLVTVGGGCGGSDAVVVDAGLDAPAGPAALCGELGLPVRAFAPGPYGVHRGELADDFSLDLRDGTTWNLRAQWSGCESYVFVPDTIPISSADPSSIWTRDVDQLIAASPRNVHYFFVSR